MPASARDRLVDAALDLFQREGFHATGIDRILSKAGVARMTLYNHFKSKDELILAALRRADERFRNWFMQEVERRATKPRERLLALFDVLADWHRRPEFHGCVFGGAASEFADAGNPIQGVCAEHKRLMVHFVRTLASDAGAPDPDALAQQLCLLMDGATAQATVCAERESAQVAARVARAVIDEALPA
ncbi:MAG: TetR/AcrR family transcriptional regulator [Phycisphaerales bacterium]